MTAEIKILEKSEADSNYVYQLIKVKNGNYIRLKSFFATKPIESALVSGIINKIQTK